MSKDCFYVHTRNVHVSYIAFNKLIKSLKKQWALSKSLKDHSLYRLEYLGLSTRNMSIYFYIFLQTLIRVLSTELCKTMKQNVSSWVFKYLCLSAIYHKYKKISFFFASIEKQHFQCNPNVVCRASYAFSWEAQDL